MAIPPEMTILEYYNQQINILVNLRDRYMTYSEDWDTLPQAVKNAIKTKVNNQITSTKLGLDDVNAAVQARV